MVTAAPAPCADLLAIELHVLCGRVLNSPDGRWRIVYRSESGATPAVHIDRRLKPATAAVTDRRTGHVIATFDMQRDAYVHWLKDRRYLVVNYWEGSDTIRPLLISLKAEGKQAPVDLREIITADAAQRAHTSPKNLDHFYTMYTVDNGRSLTLSAEFRFPIGPQRPDGSLPQSGTCYIYDVDKAKPYRYHFVREVPRKEQCPDGPPDERR